MLPVFHNILSPRFDFDFTYMNIWIYEVFNFASSLKLLEAFCYKIGSVMIAWKQIYQGEILYMTTPPFAHNQLYLSWIRNYQDVSQITSLENKKTLSTNTRKLWNKSKVFELNFLSSPFRVYNEKCITYLFQT